jgi:hypothetical protein
VGDLGPIIAEYGLTAGLVAFALYGLFQTVTKLIPDIWNWYKHDKDDRRENIQKLTEKVAATEQLERLAVMGSRSFTEEQLTAMTAETQIQLSEYSEFVRKDIKDNLQIALELLTRILDKLNRMPNTHEFRQLETKLTLMVNILKNSKD